MFTWLYRRRVRAEVLNWSVNTRSFYLAMQGSTPLKEDLREAGRDAIHDEVLRGFERQQEEAADHEEAYFGGLVWLQELVDCLRIRGDGAIEASAIERILSERACLHDEVCSRADREARLLCDRLGRLAPPKPCVAAHNRVVDAISDYVGAMAKLHAAVRAFESVKVREGQVESERRWRDVEDALAVLFGQPRAGEPAA